MVYHHVVDLNGTLSVRIGLSSGIRKPTVVQSLCNVLVAMPTIRQAIVGITSHTNLVVRDSAAKKSGQVPDSLLSAFW